MLVRLLILVCLAGCGSPSSSSSGSTPDAAVDEPRCDYALESCTASDPSIQCCGASGVDYDPVRKCRTRDPFVRACEPTSSACGGTLDVVCFVRHNADGGVEEVFISSSGTGRAALSDEGFTRCDDALTAETQTHSERCE